MKRFAELYLRLDQSNATNDKIAALTDYFAGADPADAAWAIWFLGGRRLKRLLQRANLKRFALEASGYPEWVLAETYEAVGDLAETIALLLPEPAGEQQNDLPLARWVEDRLVPLGSLDEETQGEQLKGWWATLNGEHRFVLNKLLTGALRVGVSQRLVTRALAQHLNLEPALIAHRLMGDWQPAPGLLEYLRSGTGELADPALPYPFCLAAPLEEEPGSLGSLEQWAAEWKWDGIRAQLIRRDGRTVFWSRGEERLDGRFPELEAAGQRLPEGTVLDGEILAYAGAARADIDAPLTELRYEFAALQRRIGRKKPSAAMQAEVPVHFMAYDLLEWAAEDWRPRPLAERRAQLEALFMQPPEEQPVQQTLQQKMQQTAAQTAAQTAQQTAQQADQQTERRSLPLRLSATVVAEDWASLRALRAESRSRGVEGLMLKRRNSPYGTGRQRGSWWKWKIGPLTVDAVLLYAQPGSGRRSNLLTDYTFGVWRDEELVTVCKAYSGLNNEEIRALDRWIRANTTERFGPVRAVPAEQVFEIGFEGIWASPRHKAGVAFRFPRILRWRQDLKPQDADTLTQIKGLMPSGAGDPIADPAPDATPDLTDPQGAGG